MRSVKQTDTLDGVLEPGDDIEVEYMQAPSGMYTLYVHVNGATVLRIGRIPAGTLITRDLPVTNVVRAFNPEAGERIIP